MQTLEKITPEIIKTITAAYPDVIAIYVFGSFFSGKTTPDSDLDLAILTPKKLDAYNLWKTAQNIAISINRDVDLVDLHYASTILSFQIIYKGKLIFCTDQNKIASFENIIFSEHLSFQERLTGLFADIKKRGNITHG